MSGVSGVEAVADAVTVLLVARAPTLGTGRLLTVDGPAGSGKTTLSRALLQRLSVVGSVRLVHLDDVYVGWGGLAEVGIRIRDGLVDPLSQGRPGRYQRYDWHEHALAEWHDVEPVDVLLLDGVGSSALAYDTAITLRVWVEAPADVRLARGRERDGEAVFAHWAGWLEEEAALFQRESSRERADVVVDMTATGRLAVR